MSKVIIIDDEMLAEGVVQFRQFPAPVMDASLKAAFEVYAEDSTAGDLVITKSDAHSYLGKSFHLCVNLRL